MPTDAGLCQGEGLALGKGQMPRPWDVDFGSSLRETLNLQKKMSIWISSWPKLKELRKKRKRGTDMK